MPSRRLKPLARVTRAPMLLRRQTHVLSRQLEEQLFRAAEVLSEGGPRGEGRARETYFGSTMISVDLAQLSQLRGTLDARGRRHLERALEGSVRLRLRAMRLACAEAARRVPNRMLGTAQVEVRVRLIGLQLHIDVDLEVPIRVSSGARPQ